MSNAEEKKNLLKKIIRREGPEWVRFEEMWGDWCCGGFIDSQIAEEDGILHTPGIEIDWEEDDGAKTCADVLRPLMDAELEDFYRNNCCDDDEHNEWLERLRNQLGL